MKEVGLYGQQGAAAEFIRPPRPVPDQGPAGRRRLRRGARGARGHGARGLDKVGVFPGERVLVFGTGTMGLLAVQMARRVAGRSTWSTINDAGIGAALRMGAEHAFLPGEARDGEYDVVIEASGAVPALLEALRVADVGGRIAAVGVPSDPLPAVDASELVLRGVTMTGVRHGLDYYERALRLFAEGVLSAKGMIADVFELADVDQAFELLERGRRAAPKVALSLTPRP